MNSPGSNVTSGSRILEAVSCSLDDTVGSGAVDTSRLGSRIQRCSSALDAVARCSGATVMSRTMRSFAMPLTPANSGPSSE